MSTTLTKATKTNYRAFVVIVSVVLIVTGVADARLVAGVVDARVDELAADRFYFFTTEWGAGPTGTRSTPTSCHPDAVPRK